MNPEIVNLYIERMLKEIEELTKNRLLVDTQLKYTEMMNAQFQQRIKQLEIELEKVTKKSGKKEVNTSETF
jgi:hypothetical protein